MAIMDIPHDDLLERSERTLETSREAIRTTKERVEDHRRKTPQYVIHTVEDARRDEGDPQGTPV
jgi:microcystin degradation protein MlrC